MKNLFYFLLLFFVVSCTKDNGELISISREDSHINFRNNGSNDCEIQIHALRNDFESKYFDNDEKRIVFERNFGTINWDYAMNNCQYLTSDSLTVLATYSQNNKSELVSVIFAEHNTPTHFTYSVVLVDPIVGILENDLDIENNLFEKKILENLILTLRDPSRDFTILKGGFWDWWPWGGGVQCPGFGSSGSSTWRDIKKWIRGLFSGGSGGGRGGRGDNENDDNDWPPDTTDDDDWVYHDDVTFDEYINSETGGGDPTNFCNSNVRSIGFEMLETMLSYLSQYESEHSNLIPEGVSLINILQAECEVTDYLSFSNCVTLSIGCYYGHNPTELSWYQNLMREYKCDDLGYLSSVIGVCSSCKNEEDFRRFAFNKLIEDFESRYDLELTVEQRQSINLDVENICKEGFDDEVIGILFDDLLESTGLDLSKASNETKANYWRLCKDESDFLDCLIESADGDLPTPPTNFNLCFQTSELIEIQDAYYVEFENLQIHFVKNNSPAINALVTIPTLCVQTPRSFSKIYNKRSIQANFKAAVSAIEGFLDAKLLSPDPVDIQYNLTNTFTIFMHTEYGTSASVTTGNCQGVNPIPGVWGECM